MPTLPAKGAAAAAAAAAVAVVVFGADPNSFWRRTSRFLVRIGTALRRNGSLVRACRNLV